MQLSFVFHFISFFSEHRAFRAHRALSFDVALSSLLTFSKPLTTELPPNQYLGCFVATATNGTRLLGTEAYEQNVAGLTQEGCKTFCDSHAGAPWKYFGVEFGRDCRCSNETLFIPVPAGAGECTTPMNGSSTQAGGGPNRVVVWQNANYTTVCLLSFCSSMLESSVL